MAYLQPRTNPVPLPRWLVGIILVLITGFHVVGGLHWIHQNVVFLGHDATKYLQVSIQTNQVLTPLSPQSIFQALTLDSYRPPAIFFWIQPYYTLFGVSADSAQLANIVLLALTILFTYLLGARVASQGVGIFAALLVGLLPMMIAMSRLLYTEMLLTAMVTLNLVALLGSQGFTKRGWVLLWGASLGFGLLAKWTLPLYIGLPVLWCMWKADLWSMQWAALRRLRLDWRAAVLAMVVAGVLSGLWFLPNRRTAETLVMGWWLWPGWWAMMTGLLYLAGLMRRRASPLIYAWTAILLGVLIASIWYLPHIEVFAHLLALDEERGQPDASPLSLGNLWRYVDYFYWTHLGPLAFWVIIPSAIAAGVAGWRRLRTPGAPVTMLGLAMLSALLGLTVIAQSNTRNLLPLLPAFAILLALALQHHAGIWRWGLGAIWVAVLVVQWSLFTFDVLYPGYAQTQGLWARSYYLASPSRGLTDPAYWIGPDLLQRLGVKTDVAQRLALLVNTEQIHRGVFNNLLVLESVRRDEQTGVPIQIIDITEDIADPWFRLLIAQWALLKDGDNRNVEGSSFAFVQQLLAGDPLFAHLYHEVHRYPLPDGEIATLYHRRVGPGEPGTQYALLDESRVVADAVRNAWSEHATLVYGTNNLAVYVGLHGLPTQPLVMLEDRDSQPKAVEAALNNQFGTLLIVEDAPSRERLGWLNQQAYHALAIGSDFVGLDIYGRPSQPLIEWPHQVEWPDLTLNALFSHDSVAPGQVLPVELTFASALDTTLKVSIRLVDDQGAVVASNDQGVNADVRLGLFVPPTTAPGEYRVLAILYDEATLAPIATSSGIEEVELLRIEIVPSRQP